MNQQSDTSKFDSFKESMSSGIDTVTSWSPKRFQIAMNQQSDKSTFDSFKESVSSGIDTVTSKPDNMTSKMHSSDKSSDPSRSLEKLDEFEGYTLVPETEGSDIRELQTRSASSPTYGTSHEEGKGIRPSSTSAMYVKIKNSDFGHDVKDKTSNTMQSPEEGTKEWRKNTKESASDTGSKMKDKTAEKMELMKQGVDDMTKKVKDSESQARSTMQTKREEMSDKASDNMVKAGNKVDECRSKASNYGSHVRDKAEETLRQAID
ncbi:unnamed protein product [Aphanomyces euteiches]